jgi:hypothetical protein
MLKLVLHQKHTGEIFLSIFVNKERLGELPMGLSPALARKRAKIFVDGMKGDNEIVDELER